MGMYKSLCHQFNGNSQGNPSCVITTTAVQTFISGTVAAGLKTTLFSSKGCEKSRPTAGYQVIFISGVQ